MLKALIVAVVLGAGAALAHAANLDPAMGKSAKDRHAPGNYISSTLVDPMGISAKSRHFGN